MEVLPHEGVAVRGCLVVTPDNPPSNQEILVYLNCEGRLHGDGHLGLRRQVGGSHGEVGNGYRVGSGFESAQTMAVVPVV